MIDFAPSLRSALLGRLLLVGAGVFVAVLVVGTVVLWAKLGSTVFFEAIRAGIAYCL